jgi:tRNA pseudouridine38-40 synthase
VQSVLEKALGSLYGRPIVFHAAGRTDTGVHALGQVVSFEADARIPAERLAIALNSQLPRDLAVRSAEEADPVFHARFSAKARTYGYLIWTPRTRSAIWGRYSLHIRRPVDLGLMHEAAGLLVGQKDFASFARGGGDPGPTTVRDLKRLSVRRVGSDRIRVIVTANGFLRSMVRNIAGVLLEVGYGDLPLSAVEEILAAKDRTKNPVAPAAPHGLCLLRVDY